MLLHASQIYYTGVPKPTPQTKNRKKTRPIGKSSLNATVGGMEPTLPKLKLPKIARVYDGDFYDVNLDPRSVEERVRVGFALDKLNSKRGSKYKIASTTSSYSNVGKDKNEGYLQTQSLPSPTSNSNQVQSEKYNRANLKYSSAIIIQSSFRSWLSRMMVENWIEYTQIIASADFNDFDEYSNPSAQSSASSNYKLNRTNQMNINLFQIRLAKRAYKRKVRTKLKLIVHTWRTLASHKVSLRERILQCHNALKLKRRVQGWFRVCKREAALLRVVRSQSLIMRKKYLRIWQILNQIHNTITISLKMHLRLWKHYQKVNVPIARSFWISLTKTLVRRRCAMYIQHWLRGRRVLHGYKQYVRAALFLKDKILRSSIPSVLSMTRNREDDELGRISRERATMKKISRRAVTTMREYIVTDTGREEFEVYWRVVRKRQIEVKALEERKARLLDERNTNEKQTVMGDVSKLLKQSLHSASENYKNSITRDYRPQSYLYLEDRITYDSRALSRFHFRKKQPPLFSCVWCKAPFVWEWCLNRHYLLHTSSITLSQHLAHKRIHRYKKLIKSKPLGDGLYCLPVQPKNIEWIQAESVSQGSMKMIVDIFYRSSVHDSSVNLLDNANTNANTDANDDDFKTTAGNENLTNKTVSFLPPIPEPSQPPKVYCKPSEHPEIIKFKKMIAIVGVKSVKKRMVSLGFDPDIIDEGNSGWMIGLEGSVYKNRRVPDKVLNDDDGDGDGDDEEVEEMGSYAEDAKVEIEEKKARAKADEAKRKFEEEDRGRLFFPTS